MRRIGWVWSKTYNLLLLDCDASLYTASHLCNANSCPTHCPLYAANLLSLRRNAFNHSDFWFLFSRCVAPSIYAAHQTFRIYHLDLVRCIIHSINPIFARKALKYRRINIIKSDYIKIPTLKHCLSSSNLSLKTSYYRQTDFPNS